jgi:hypothetical protein
MADFPYKVGDVFKAQYDYAPILPEHRYPIGEEVTIFDNDTKQAVAAYRVTGSDCYFNWGKIICLYPQPQEQAA